MRSTWNETWMRVAEAVAGRSRCCRRSVGAVIVDPDNRIIATGFNGPPANLGRTKTRDCSRWCPRAIAIAAGDAPTDTHETCLAIHAEANALLFCDRREREGGTIYTTTVPCYECAKLIANSGLAKVVYRDNGEADEHLLPNRTVRILEDSGVGVVRYE